MLVSINIFRGTCGQIGCTPLGGSGEKENYTSPKMLACHIIEDIGNRCAFLECRNTDSLEDVPKLRAMNALDDIMTFEIHRILRN